MSNPAHKRKRFFASCVSCPGTDAGSAINDMCDSSKLITRKTFLRQVHPDDMRDLERSLGYATGCERGLHMKADYHVSYNKSVFRGQPVVYFINSAIEYIFKESNNIYGEP